MSEPEIWEIAVEVNDKEAVAAIEEIVAEVAESTAAFEDDKTKGWRVTGYATEAPDEAALRRRLQSAAADAGLGALDIRIGPMPPTDWVAEVEKTLKPISVGPYYIYGSHVTDPPPDGAVAIHVDAGLAFGTGNHETTRGCLMALERLFPETGPGNPLDVGTGSGILAIALAKRYGVRAFGSDIDPIAIDVARENAEINGVADLVGFTVCAGLEAPEIAARGPYDLIFANIVVDPLVALADDLTGALADGGRLVLSGILAEQASRILDAYGTGQGLRASGVVALAEWRTMIFEKA
jgi:ribosomal protein L11 methyltransferase